jgi:rod shape-determining protein MreC
VALEDSNRRYRALLGFQTNPPIPMTAAHVILDARGPFADTRLADAGKERGVEVGNPVMSERGLIGRVIGVTHGASRIMLLTDVASRTPVLVDRTDARAILTGDAGATPKLDYLRGGDPIKDGDRILTSGDGGMIPRGLPVGTAVKGLDGAWRVRLVADETSIDFVRILLFKDFSQLVNQQELSQQALPPVPAASGPAQTVTMAPPGATAAPPAAIAKPTVPVAASVPITAPKTAPAPKPPPAASSQEAN